MNFKIIQIVVFSLFTFANAWAQSKAEFKISINSIPSITSVQLQSLDQNLNFNEVAKGSIFEFEGAVKYPTVFLLTVNQNKKNSKIIFVENNTITINIENLEPFSFTMLGSYNQQLLADFEKLDKTFWNDIYTIDQNNKSNYIPEKDFHTRQQKYSKLIRDFIQNHPGDRASTYLASINSDYIIDGDLQYIFEIFSKTNQESDYGQQIKAEIKLRKNTELGTWLGDLEQKDLNSENYKFHDLKGKYALLYFWKSDLEASRKENLRLKKWSENFSKDLFEIVAVNLDLDPKDWERAVLEDNLNWINLSDLKGWDNKIAKRLGISMVPYSLLLDREGMIIARDPKIEELDKIVPLMLSQLGTGKTAPNPKRKKEPKVKQPKAEKPSKNKQKVQDLPTYSIDADTVQAEKVESKKKVRGRFKPKSVAPKTVEE